MARRRRARKRWQKMITRLMVALITDVRDDFRRAHVQAVKGRVARIEPTATRASAEAMTSYDVVHPARGGTRIRQTSNGPVWETWGTEPPWEPPSSMTDTQKDARRRDHRDLQMAGLDAAGQRDVQQRQQAWGRMTLDQRQNAARNAGLCGAPTKDKSPCLNPKGCSIPSHQRNKRK